MLGVQPMCVSPGPRAPAQPGRGALCPPTNLLLSSIPVASRQLL
jgi:hypothetical protein